jgi:hypothetical protein
MVLVFVEVELITVELHVLLVVVVVAYFLVEVWGVALVLLETFI